MKIRSRPRLNQGLSLKICSKFVRSIDSEQTLCTRYQLQQQLGRTGAGRQTWRSTDLETKESVIVKLLAFSPQIQWQELELFEREAKVLQNLSHPRIPRYRDYFSLDQETGGGLPWFGLVQDYIPGSSLQDLLEQGTRWTEPQVNQMAIDVLEILTYLHELSPPVLHRDIKPSNLIWGEDNQIYLVDFGAVQAQAAVTGVTFTVVGTSGYAPLEQFWGRSVAASDLYALGATLIHLLTGTAPADLPQKRSRLQFADRVSLSPAFVSWLTKLTDPILEERFTTARKAEAALRSGQMIRTITQVSPVKKIPRPNDSRIQIRKSDKTLEIYVPSLISGGLYINQPFRGIKILLTIAVVIPVFSIAGLGVFVIFFHAFLSLLGIKIDIELYGWYFTILVSSLPCLIIVFMMLNWLTVGSQTRLDRHKFETDYRTFGLALYQRTRLTSNITGVLIRSKYDTGTQIFIQVGDESCYLKGSFTEGECFWLVQEIQDWLNQ